MLYICETKDIDMTTITINKRTKAGKLIFEMAKLLSEKEKGVVISEDEKPRYNTETEKVIKDVRLGVGIIKADSVDELFEKLKS
ncbi:MAG TPA: hypothetical protein DCP54_12775 [Chryseobacterium sp.]|nr:hypothetical protein [Chryseobacterium sp.]